jgi:hypothetical protein
MRRKDKQVLMESTFIFILLKVEKKYKYLERITMSVWNLNKILR